MSDTPNIDELKESVRRLALLLDDPQPGLAMWMLAFAKQARELHDLLRQHVEPPIESLSDDERFARFWTHLGAAAKCVGFKIWMNLPEKGGQS